MNIVFINNFFVECMVSEIPRVSVFGHCPYSVTFPYTYCMRNLVFPTDDDSFSNVIN